METFDDRAMSSDPDKRHCERDRLFIGIYSTGIAYADRQQNVAGDYKRLAFLSFATLELEIERDCPADLASRIKEDATSVQQRRGEAFKVSTAGQTVTLGYAL